MNVYNLLVQNNLSFKLTPVHIRELIFLAVTPCDIYGQIDGIFHIVVTSGSPIGKDSFQRIVDLGLSQLFVTYEDYQILKKSNQKILLDITRSLSAGEGGQGNILPKAKKQVYFLSLNLNYLYQAPADDDTLSLQYCCLRGLGELLLNKMNLVPSLYQYLSEQRYHYTVSQPLLSSLLLLNYLKSTQQYGEKEILSLFITSYFKDIGLALIPKDFLDKDNLSINEKRLIMLHQNYSASILDGRTALNKNYLIIIKNHHQHSTLALKDVSGRVLTGAETLFVEMVDILIAMSTSRPYRSEIPLYSCLLRLKKIMGREYLQEFKLLVRCTQHFYKVDPFQMKLT